MIPLRILDNRIDTLEDDQWYPFYPTKSHAEKKLCGFAPGRELKAMKELSIKHAHELEMALMWGKPSQVSISGDAAAL